jgi:glycosyltransferase involved in cell wall biosynthesis
MISKVTAIILTFNEEIHLQRCIDSVRQLTNDIYVVDSFSTDTTVEIAKRNKVQVLQKRWEGNHSIQFNWALTQIPVDSSWILRIDADEVLESALIQEVKEVLNVVSDQVMALRCNRKMIFQGYLLRHGGLKANRVQRLFRYGHGQSESRWMDEHIAVDGLAQDLSGAIIDDNLNPLSFWIEKHNNYASKEALELLNIKYSFLQNTIHAQGSVNSVKRFVKNNVYAVLPGGLRALLYYIYRYIFLLGFLDEKRGKQFHFLQGFWYRYLVDCKVAEVERYMQQKHVSIKTAIQKVLNIKL